MALEDLPNSRCKAPISGSQPTARDMIGPSILVGLIPGFPYMMPPEFLPMMDCPNCIHIKNPELGHCYMFRVKPEGDRCGQFTAGPVDVAE